MRRMKRLILAVTIVLPACGGGARTAPQASSVPEAPLNSFAATELIVLPVQTLRTGDAMGWAAKVSGTRAAQRAFLASIDSVLEAAVREKGLVAWALPSDLARTARRNPTYVANPADIRAGDAAGYMSRNRDENIPEPVASQLRALAGFHGSRYALIPVEVRFEPGSTPSTGRAVLRIAVLDVRGSRLAFIGDIIGAEAPDYTPAVNAAALRFIALVVP
jgi:hypothetical protein